MQCCTGERGGFNQGQVVEADPIRTISASPGANVKASKVITAQSPRLGVAVLSDALTREKAIMTRLMLAALSGTIFAFAAILTTVIEWTVLGWRNFWLAVCIAGFCALITFLWVACKRL